MDNPFSKSPAALADVMVKYTPVTVSSSPSPSALAGTTLAPRPKGAKAPAPAPAPAPSPKQSEDLFAEARGYISANEGTKNAPYKDSKGLWTVGIGHLMSPEEVRQMSGKTLSQQQVDEIFARDLNSKMRLAKRELGAAYDKLPTGAKVAVLDGFFRGDLSGSPEALKLIRAGKLAEAADEYLDNNEYRASVALNKKGEPHGVAGRMERNAAVLRAASTKR
jgi:GH24 family phage-related lysozyme (muramidase)